MEEDFDETRRPEDDLLNGIYWSDSPDVPEKKGYYITFYYEPGDRKYFYKAIWWDGNEWVRWRLGQQPPKIIAFIEESRNDYYCPCMEFLEKKD